MMHLCSNLLSFFSFLYLGFYKSNGKGIFLKVNQPNSTPSYSTMSIKEVIDMITCVRANEYTRDRLDQVLRLLIHCCKIYARVHSAFFQRKCTKVEKT